MTIKKRRGTILEGRKMESGPGGMTPESNNPKAVMLMRSRMACGCITMPTGP